MRWVLALVGLFLVAAGLVSLIQPVYAPGRPAGGQISHFLEPPDVALRGGLYVKALLEAKGGGEVMYLRCFVYDAYRGGSWSRGAEEAETFGEGVVSLGTGPWSKAGELNLTAPLMGNCVPVATGPIDGRPVGSVRVYAPGAKLRASAEGLYVAYLGGSISYVASYLGGGEPYVSIDGRYLQIPPDVEPVVKKIAEEITGGCVDDGCKVARIKEFLRGFQYDGGLDALWPEVPPTADPVVWFLTEGRRGVCIHFASAFVLLARAAGIPARLVVGYVSDAPVPDQWAYVLFTPHAWAEYYVKGVGWVGVEATPGYGASTPVDVLDVENPPAGGGAVQLPSIELSGGAQWWAAALAAAVVLLAVTSISRYKTVVVGDSIEFKRPRGFAVYLNNRPVGRTPVKIVFNEAGVYVARVGPLLYVIRVVDYRKAAGRLFAKLLKRLGLPGSTTPRELAAAYPEFRHVVELFEKIRYSPRVSREDFEAFRKAI